MISLLSKTLNKDNSGIKKVKCISTLNKPKIKPNQPFKAVIIDSNSQTLVRGQLVNSLFISNANFYLSPTGKAKKFSFSASFCLKELNRNNIVPLSNRLTGVQSANLKALVNKKSNLSLGLIK